MGLFSSFFLKKTPTDRGGDCAIKVIYKGKEITLLLTEQEFVAAAERAVRELNAIPIDDDWDESDKEGTKEND
jgi:hypothetical protein